jgi:hypothetical protein
MIHEHGMKQETCVRVPQQHNEKHNMNVCDSRKLTWHMLLDL